MNVFTICKARCLLKMLLLALLVVSFTENVYSQQRQSQQKTSTKTVNGTVYDKDNEPLAGVAVYLKSNNSIGVSTNNKGIYTIGNIPTTGNQTLVFSLIGMKNREVAIKDQKEIIVTLEEKDETIQEVIVTGLYNRNKESITGSASTFSAKDIKMIGSQNVIQSLRTLDPSFMVIESKQWGSNPNRMPDIEIRGKTTIVMDQGLGGLKTAYDTDPNQPLFILDGVETILETIVNLNIDRVASVTLLKDAASTAIYGSKAANGVVVVETKQPEAGQLRLSYNGNYGLQFADLSAYNLMNAEEKLEFEKLTGKFDGTSFVDQLAKDAQYDRIKKNILKGIDTYWMNEPLRTVFNHSHNLYADGGDNAMRYGVGVSYNNSNGVMKGSDRSTLSGNIDLTYRKGKLLFSNKFSYDMAMSDNEPVSFSEFSRQNPYYSKFNDNGTIRKYMMYEAGTGDKEPDTFIVNPLYKMGIINSNTQNNNSIRENFQIEWRILPELRATGRLNLTKGTAKTTRFKSPEHPDFYESDVTNKGSYSESTVESFSYNCDLNVAYGKLFNEMHQVNAVAGTNVRESTGETSGYSLNGFIDDLHQNPAFSVGFKDKQKPSYSSSISRSASFFLNANYSFKSRYLLDFNLRSEGTSVFGRTKRFSTTWSAGIAWNIHNEKFVKENAPVINLMKVRFTYGNPGTQNFDAYQAMKTYMYTSDNMNMFGNSVIIDKFGNKDLEWQRTNDMNFGLDVALFKNKLRITADGYKKTTDPLLVVISSPASMGVVSIYSNFGGQVSWGYSFSVNYTIMRTDDLIWSVNFNNRYGESYFTNIGDKLNYLNKDNIGSSSQLRRYYEGTSPDDMWAVRSLGIDPATGHEMFLDKNGRETFKWEATDEVIVGNTRPDAEGVIGTSFSWRGFSASLNFRFRIGGQVQASALMNKVENITADGVHENQDRRALVDRWQKPGDVAKYKNIKDLSPTKMSSRFVLTENTFSGESISIGYDATIPWLKKNVGVSGVTVRAYMNDIFRLTTFKEERGLDYPFARSISFSLGLRF